MQGKMETLTDSFDVYIIVKLGENKIGLEGF